MAEKIKEKDSSTFDRRTFVTGAVSAIGAAAVGAGTITSPQVQAAEGRGTPAPSSVSGNQLYRLEADVKYCEVSGTIPDDLKGAFYRTGPDPQFPMAPGNIPFDGEGHVSMWRFENGQVHYKSRFVRNDRYLAQEDAGKILFPMYRNPAMDDPSVAGLSRGTANTHIINHKNVLLALKEDSPPSALDLLTLETVEANFTFDGQLPSETFTAHPKVDSLTGNIVAFGYEATGHGSHDVSLFEFTPNGELAWNAMIQVPYVCLLHDFAVTENHIIMYVYPLAFDADLMARGGIHWSWDKELPTYLGVLRRDGDGSDVRWIKGPTKSSLHTMGAFEDKNRVYIDLDMSPSNPFPFMPNKDGSPWAPTGGSFTTRLSADISSRSPKNYTIETLNSEYAGGLPRQDDRYNTMPYTVGFLPTRAPSGPNEGNAGYARFDHPTGKVTFFDAGPGVSLAECCFAPKHANVAEGEGYLVGVASYANENGRSDLVILDAQHLDEGPIAKVHLPMAAAEQVHGWWVPEAQLPVG